MGSLILAISPLGFFFSDNKAENSYSVSNIIARVSQDWYDELAAQREHYESLGYRVNVSYNTGAGDGVERVNNWKDALALYIARNTDISKNMIELNDSDEAGIKGLYFEMNPINISTRVEEAEKDGEIKEVKYADISVSNLRYVQMLSEYPLDSFQNDMIDFLMRPDMNATWADMGIDFNGGTDSNADVNTIIHDLPIGSLGSAIVQAALSRLGDPYSMELRGQGNYVDCSYLVQWAYAQAGISIPGTAAEQARYCVENNGEIDASALRTGDLIFWSYPNNPRVAGRFMDIGHVAIYVQNGMMIEAAPSAGCVTYRTVSVQGEPSLYGRLDV
jgi:cell wall-associated NlpC family hydrolase